MLQLVSFLTHSHDSVAICWCVVPVQLLHPLVLSFHHYKPQCYLGCWSVQTLPSLFHICLWCSFPCVCLSSLIKSLSFPTGSIVYMFHVPMLVVPFLFLIFWCFLHEGVTLQGPLSISEPSPLPQSKLVSSSVDSGSVRNSTPSPVDLALTFVRGLCSFLFFCHNASFRQNLYVQSVAFTFCPYPGHASYFVTMCPWLGTQPFLLPPV